MIKTNCVNCGKEFEEDNMINELLGLDLKSDTNLCVDCIKIGNRNVSHKMEIEEICSKFDFSILDDAEKVVRICVRFVNQHSGDNLEGLTPEAKFMHTYINDFMKLYAEGK